MTRFRSLLPALLAGAVAACSLLLKEDVGQCDSTPACVQLGFDGYICKDQVCIRDPELMGSGGNAGSSGAGGKSSDGGSGKGGAPSPGGTPNGGIGGASAGAVTGGSAGSGGAVMGGSAGSAGSGGGPSGPPCKTAACEAAGGSCEDDVCVIACNVADCAPLCPSGMACRVECAAESCKNLAGVDCGQASSCEVHCGASSCLNGVVCAGSSCAVFCTGDKSCSLKGITCRADVCEFTCTGLQSCITWACKDMPAQCSATCGGIQSCGTLTESNATKTDIVCDAEGACAAATTVALCCDDGATCTGDFAPNCN